MSQYEIAQLNVAIMKEPLQSPGMADFVASLDRINALAESTPGFVWRLQTEEAIAKLDLLRLKGPTPEAFTFRQAFLAPDARQPKAPFAFGGERPA